MILIFSSGNENILKMLIEKGADVNITNSQGSTALHSATIKGNVFENPFCSFILNDSKLKIIEETPLEFCPSKESDFRFVDRAPKMV